MRHLYIAVICLALVGCGGKGKPGPVVGRELPSVELQEPLEMPGLHNVVAYGPAMLSGSAPVTEEAFDTLQGMGIRTVISVDGAQPEVEMARAHGMRYVHLPITYAEISESRKLELARAVDVLDGPVYIHCHHGKHRSAGAAAAVAIELGILTPEQGVARMRVSGTSDSYPGLYRCAGDTRPLDRAALDAVPTEFPEHWTTSGIVQTMVQADEVSDYLSILSEAGWVTPADHPDLVPAAEAGRLADLFRAFADGEEVRDKPAAFFVFTENMKNAAQALETSIVEKQSTEIIEKNWQAAVKSCRDCHRQYRNK